MAKKKNESLIAVKVDGKYLHIKIGPSHIPRQVEGYDKNKKWKLLWEISVKGLDTKIIPRKVGVKKLRLILNGKVVETVSF